MYDGAIGAGPFWEGSSSTSGDVPKRGTSEDLEEGVTHFLEILLELALDVDDESGCDRGKQTGLLSDQREVHKETKVCVE